MDVEKLGHGVSVLSPSLTLEVDAGPGLRRDVLLSLLGSRLRQLEEDRKLHNNLNTV
jgi:hypothetical protein